jgi:hypothetical protein
LRVGQRPGLDELRQQRRNNRESGQAEDFGGAYGGNNRRRRRCRGGLSQSQGSHEKTPVGGTGVLGVEDRAGGLLGTREWFVIHHTDCGMLLFTNDMMLVGANPR